MIRQTISIIIAVASCGRLYAQEDRCLHPVGDYIVARDLVAVVPEFWSIPQGKLLAPAPVLGGKRSFRTDELRSLAAQSGVKVEPTADVCFAWPVAPLDRTEVLETLRKSLNVPDALIEIADLTSDRVPPGQLSFPLSGLAAPASPDQQIPVMWRGEVLYGDTRRFTIWARVRISAPVAIVVAVEKLEPGHLIAASQLRTEIKQRFPSIKNKGATVDQVTGMLPLRSFAPGAELRLENLTRPNDVNRGDVVSIEVRNGRVKLAFSGRAESAGRTGDLIAVRNPDTKRIFQARVSAPNKAVVDSGFNQGN